MKIRIYAVFEKWPNQARVAMSVHLNEQEAVNEAGRLGHLNPRRGRHRANFQIVPMVAQSESADTTLFVSAHR